MLLRHLLPLAGVAAAAPSASSTNTHSFTANDTLAVASDVKNRTFKTYSSGRHASRFGLVGDDDEYFTSPIFWSAMLDHGRLASDEMYDMNIHVAIEERFGPKGTFAWDKAATPDFIRDDLDITNDDVAIWAQFALNAAERDFETQGLTGTWIKYAQDIFDFLSPQWDMPKGVTGGGLPSSWRDEDGEPTQFFFASINGNFFHLSARLAHATGEKKYADWASKILDWMVKVTMIDAEFTVHNGVEDDPTRIVAPEPHFTLLSSDSAIVAAGAAYMYNVTNGDAKWKTRVEGLVGQIKTTFFTKDGILVEECETKTESYYLCYEQAVWEKAQTPPLLMTVIQQANFTADTLVPLLKSNGAVVAQSCVQDTSSPCKPNVAHAHFDEGVDEMGNYLAALTALNAVLSLDMLPAIGKGSNSADTKDWGESKSDSSKSGTKDDKSMASSLSGASSVWGLTLVIMVGIMSM